MKNLGALRQERPRIMTSDMEGKNLCQPAGKQKRPTYEEGKED